jgi:hypothetical protein
MTTVADIIQAAYRETNLIPLGSTPTTAQTNEALPLFNTLIMSTMGNEVGDSFTDVTIGGLNDQSDTVANSVPYGVRLVMNIEVETELDLDPNPYDGQRLAVVDTFNTLGTYNLILNGNGRLIEDAFSVTLNTDGETRQWMYRADIGNWVVVDSLAAIDLSPFPPEFDDYFITMLAMRLNPRYGQSLTPETAEALKRMRSQIRGRYHNFKEVASDIIPIGWFGLQRTLNFDTGV